MQAPLSGRRRRGLKTPAYIHALPARGFAPKPAAWPKLRPYQVHAERAIIAPALHARGLTITVVMGRLADLLGEVWRVRRLAVDATGLGETLARLLARRLGDSVLRPVRFTAESKSKLGYGLLAAVNGGRLKLYAADGSPEYAQFQREIEFARAHFRPSQQMNFFVKPTVGHDDYLVSAALVVHATNDIETRPRIARGRVTGDEQ